MASFLAAADKRAEGLYGRHTRDGPDIPALVAADARYFVARENGRAVGGGGYVLFTNRNAEMKRLFTDPAARGRGVGASVVQVIERNAADEGVRTLFLETGVRSAEALGLYRKLGFTECSPFGSYEPDTLSVFMMKGVTRA